MRPCFTLPQCLALSLRVCPLLNAMLPLKWSLPLSLRASLPLWGARLTRLCSTLSEHFVGGGPSVHSVRHGGGGLGCAGHARACWGPSPITQASSARRFVVGHVKLFPEEVEGRAELSNLDVSMDQALTQYSRPHVMICPMRRQCSTCILHIKWQVFIDAAMCACAQARCWASASSASACSTHGPCQKRADLCVGCRVMKTLGMRRLGRGVAG